MVPSIWQNHSKVIIPANVLAFRYENLLAYVKPATDHEVNKELHNKLVSLSQRSQKAIECAKSVFPCLSYIRNDHIAFRLTVHVEGEIKMITISPDVWSTVISTLTPFKILDIVLLDSNDYKAPPQYTSTLR